MTDVYLVQDEEGNAILITDYISSNLEYMAYEYIENNKGERPSKELIASWIKDTFKKLGLKENDPAYKAYL